MKRRGFLRSLLGIATAPAIPKPSIFTKGLIKDTTSAVVSTVASKGIINVGSHPKLIWPGIKAAWDEHYGKDYGLGFIISKDDNNEA